MTSPLLAALADALARSDAPPAGAHVLVATSGGPDSTALLVALATLAGERGLRVTAAHVDHALRGDESAEDARAVAALATGLGLPVAIAAAPVRPGPNLEARARAVRHRALRVLRRERGGEVIALAHTEDDQVETVLLRLLRGTGRRGLGGMRPRSGALWRPLLAVTRNDVRRFLAERAVPFRLDRTNADLAHARNRLRRLVVPLLAREFNPQLGRTVADLARRLRDEDDVLEGLAAARLDVLRDGDALAAAVAGEPPALQRRVVRAWLDGGKGRPATARQIDRILALAGGAGGDVALAGPVRVVCETGRLHLRPGRQDDPAPFRYAVRLGEGIEGPEGAWRLVVSAARPRTAVDPSGLGPDRAAFDADLLAFPLVVRPVAHGDRMRVPGVGSRKLQDVLVDAKVPRERRARCPILADAQGRIVWVAGVARGDVALVGPDTRRVVDATIE